MVLMLLYLCCLLLGYFLGSRLRRYEEILGKPLNVLMLVIVSGLVFIMGIRMGSNEEIIANLGTIGLQALLFTVVVVFGGVLSVTITRSFFHMDKLGRLRGQVVSSDCESAQERGDDEKTSSNLMTWLIVIFVVLGLLFGYFFIRTSVRDVDGFNAKAGTLMTVGLCVLLGTIGMDMGFSGTVAEQLKQVGLRVLLFPVAVLIGTTVTSALLSFVLPLTLRECLAIGYGFGWYTFAPVTISGAGHVIAGAVSFMHNVIRETLGLVLIPVLAKKIGYIEVCSLPGVSATDIGLTIVEKATRPDIMVYAFAIGISQNFLVPILVPLAIGA